MTNSRYSSGLYKPPLRNPGLPHRTAVSSEIEIAGAAARRTYREPDTMRAPGQPFRSQDPGAGFITAHVHCVVGCDVKSRRIGRAIHSQGRERGIVGWQALSRRNVAVSSQRILVKRNWIEGWRCSHCRRARRQANRARSRCRGPGLCRSASRSAQRESEMEQKKRFFPCVFL
jgi:hypothetical protein